MLVGYARISKADGSQSLDLQRDALAAAGVAPEQIYEDRASGKRDDRPGLEACLKALRDGDALVVWKLDRLGRDLAHLVAIVRDLERRGVAEFERDLIHERVMAGLSAARARGRRGGAPYKMTAAKLRLAQAAMGNPETRVRGLCREIGVSSQTLYRHVAPDGQLRPDGLKLLGRAKP